jgi:hypothetical protein
MMSAAPAGAAERDAAAAAAAARADAPEELLELVTEENVPTGELVPRARCHAEARRPARARVGAAVHLRARG